MREPKFINPARRMPRFTGKWRDVGTTKPEVGDVVLVATRAGYVSLAYWSGKRWYWTRGAAVSFPRAWAPLPRFSSEEEV